MAKRFDPSSRSWTRVALVTIFGTCATMALSLLATSYLTEFMPRHAAQVAWVAGVILPVLIAVPVLFYFSSQMRRLAVVQHELALIASEDSLTTCLNRGAFITLVDAYLNHVNASQTIEGALLVVDADHFKWINDQYGHANGDVALRLIAEKMKSQMRATDLIGRIGGEEFGIFLPRTNAPQALAVAERIRWAVEQSGFSPDGQRAQISVSIGAAMFNTPLAYETLFRSADRLLYEAKSMGRNRVVHRLVGAEAA